MNYIDKNLISNEKILLYSKPHWIIFTSAVIWLIISMLIFTICRNWDFFNTILFNHPVYIWLSLAALFIAIIHAISTYLRYVTSKYAITNKRILIKTGLLRHNVLEIFLDKIESVHVTQSIIGRMLNYGTITIRSPGGNQEPLRNVPYPVQFKKIIHLQSGSH